MIKDTCSSEISLNDYKDIKRLQDYRFLCRIFSHTRSNCIEFIFGNGDLSVKLLKQINLYGSNIIHDWL